MSAAMACCAGPGWEIPGWGQVTPALSTVRVQGYATGQAARLALDRTGPRVVDVGFELLLRDSG